MFEQSTLPSGPASKRLWATCLGVTGEALLVGFAVLAPMLWPQVLPRTTLITSLLPPVPQGRPKPVEDRPRPAPARVPRLNILHQSGFFAPSRVPDRVVILVDPPTQIASGPGVIGGISDGVPGSVNSTILDGMLGPGSAPPTPRIVEPNHAPVAKRPIAEVRQVRVGGDVKMAQLQHRVEPQYPAIAKAARIQGVVELVGVIATDGRLKELRLVSGHPLLAGAAMEAVSQWIYRPTTLNGEPVEVIAPITVTFRLN
jgi:periplasmic protein TonB